MVFQRKGGFKGKQQTPAKQKGKKTADTDAFFEQESDDSESGQLVKTPGGKTPKGKQSQGDKRVSFQIPGKNTPNKTPKNEHSLVKKQPTPGKPQSALKEFKGLLQNNSAKKNKPAKKPADDDDEDDDDDDNDDDEDDDDDDDIDLDMLGDDDDDDDDDEDEEEDDSEDEEETSNKQKQVNAIQKKQNNVEKNKTPSKGSEKSPVKALQASAKKEPIKKPVDEDDEDDDSEDDEDIEMDMLLGEDDDSEDEESEEEDEKPQQKKHNLKQNQMNISQTSQKSQIQGSNASLKKEKTPTKNDKTSQVLVQQAKTSPKKSENKEAYQKAMEVAEERKRERDVRVLFIGNLPKDVVASELKALSADIVNVSIPHSNSAKKRKYAFAFLEFANEAKAEENFKTLKNKKLRGQLFNVDYSGCKRQNAPKEDSPPINLKKLFVSSIPVNATMDKIAALFPKAIGIQLNAHPTYRNAAVTFLTEEETSEAIEKTKNAKIDGKSISVMYSISKTGGKKRKRSRGNKQQQQGAKKIKAENKKESDDDDDDDDDDDEEE